MKRTLFLLSNFLLIFFTLSAQQTRPLYDGPAPGSENWNWNEKEATRPDRGNMVYNVSNPSVEIYKPAAGQENGTAVIIAPGGGFHFLSIDNEGRNLAKALTAKGVTCFILHYRLVQVHSDDPAGEFLKKMGTSQYQQDITKLLPLAINDARQAISLVRKNAQAFNINPHRIGIIGFSAGGTLAAASLFNFTAENKPDFAATIYPFFPSALMGNLTSSAPPLFIAVASDDNLGLTSHSIDLYNKWLNAKIPVELHAYAKGGHGFGTRPQNLPVDSWLARYTDWLNMQGLLTKKTENPAFADYQKKEFVFAGNQVLPYRILYPENYTANKKYPLVVFLHGSGERGYDNEAQLTHGGSLFSRQDIRKQYPAIVVFPQCPEGISWNAMSVDRTKNPVERSIDYSNSEPWPLAATHSLIEHLIQNEKVDKSRVYLSGLSMGGFGSFEMAYRHPKTFAAVLPICGGGDLKATDKRVKKIPFWVFHGSADPVVDVKLSREMVAKLKSMGAKVKYSEYPGVGHNSWDNAFAEPGYLKWMFEQKK